MLTFGSTLVVLLLALLHVRCDNHQYQAIIDSGSTGSRVYIYRYNVDAPLQTIEELHSKRVDPALATFYKNRAGLHAYLNELVSFVEEKVDRSFHSKTSMSLKATAGLRTISAHERDWIITEVHHVLRNSSFVFNPVETRVLTGGEEALFGLLAINIAFSNLTNKLELSMGAGDLGGSSQQVAFVVPPKTFLQSFIDSYLQPFGMWPSSATTSSVAKQGAQASQSASSSATTNDGSGNSSSSGPSNDESHTSEDITDECLPNFAVTFPTPSNSLMSTLFAPFAALATTYSPAALLAGTGWLPSDLTRNTLSKSQVSSPLAQHPALQSAFLSKPYDSSVTINIYAKSMAGMGLVAAMNETFYFIAQNHQRRIQRRSALILAQSTMSSSSDTQSSTTLRSHRRAYDWSDAHICHSSLDLSDANTRYCHEKWEQPVSTNNDTMLSSGDHHQHQQHVVEDIEITENNDGDHLYGEHASWLHALQSTDEIVDNPCAPPGENLPYPDALSTLRWQGTGDFETCVRYTRHLVKVHALRDRKCLSQWQPQLPSSFIMMDNFPKVLQVLQLPIDQLSSSLTPAMIRQRGREICQQPWTVLQEVYPRYPAYRVQQVCFAASFLYVLMTDVYDMAEGDETLALASLPVPTWRTLLEPATLPSSTPTTTSVAAAANSVANISALTSSHAFLTPPTGASSMRFVAMDSHDSFTIGWSLGAAIISAMNITYTEELDASAMQLVTRPSSFVAMVAEGDGSTGALLCDLVADTYATDAASLSRLSSEMDGAAALVVVNGDVDRHADGSEGTADASSSSSNVCPMNSNDGAAVPADDGSF